MPTRWPLEPCVAIFRLRRTISAIYITHTDHRNRTPSSMLEVRFSRQHDDDVEVDVTDIPTTSSNTLSAVAIWVRLEINPNPKA